METAAHQPLSDEDFREQLVAIVPALRAFARGLCGGRDVADDLVQDTMVRAWAARTRFNGGTNFRAWMYTILRNQFYTLMRKSRRHQACEPDLAERTLIDPGGQEQHILVNEVAAALQRLTPAHREVLMLIGANELEYAEAADILDCAVGTVKSRLCRARRALAMELYGSEATDFDTVFGEREGMWEMAQVTARA